MHRPLAIKDAAPDFSLPDAQGAAHALREALGRPVVLVFYPGDMTPGCTLQLRAFRDEYRAFEEAGASVFGINPAPAASHAAFQDALKLPFPLLVDKGSKVAKAYGAVRRFLGLTLVRRTVVVVGANGRIAFIRHGLPKGSDVLKAVLGARTAN